MQIEKFDQIPTILAPTQVEFCWKNHKLTRPHLEGYPPIDLSLKMNLEDSLAFLSSELGFMAQTKVHSVAKEAFSNFETEEYFLKCGYSSFNFLKQALELIPNLPHNFRLWAEEKKLNPKDFRVLHGFSKNALEQIELLEMVSKLQPTKNTGLLILEYGMDLYHLQQLDIETLAKFTKPDSFLNHLKRKRFSKTLDRDETIKNKIEKIELTQNTNLKLERRGDERFLKLEILASHPTQVVKTLEKLKSKFEHIDLSWN